jgi:hypothetical protein
VTVVGGSVLLAHRLLVDGVGCGPVLSVQGGWGLADVVEEPSPTGVNKRPGPPRWEELELQLALRVPAPLANWVAAAWRGEVQAKNVAIQAMFQTMDSHWSVLHQREFRNVLLTEATISTLSHAPYQPGVLTLRLLPQDARTTSAFTGVVRTTTSTLIPPPPRPMLVYPNLLLPGLDTSKVWRVEALTVRQAFGSAIPPSPGSGVWLEPGPLSFPNLTVELHEVAAGDWQQWFENFVVQGHNDATNEKTGTLRIVDERGRLVEIGLSNVGIFQLTGPIETPTPDGPLIKVVAGLYCQRMTFRVV